MNSVEKVKSICKERKIPISRLEKDLGYGNGYIGQLKKGVFPDDRLVEIANYLSVPTSFLTGEEQKENPATESSEVAKEVTPIKKEAIDLIMEMSDEQLAIFVAALKASKGGF